VATAAVLTGLALALGACDDGGGDAEPPEPTPQPPPPETIHRVPDLPDRWEVHVNRAAGFAFGLPPGWRARDRGIQTLVRSFDRLTAVSIVPDRTVDAIELPLDDFAGRAFAALGGFAGQLEPAAKRPIAHRYRAVELRTTATADETGIRQRVRLIVIRRGRQVTFTVVIASNVDGGRASERIAERTVRTLRSRPVGPAPSP